MTLAAHALGRKARMCVIRNGHSRPDKILQHLSPAAVAPCGIVRIDRALVRQGRIARDIDAGDPRLFYLNALQDKTSAHQRDIDRAAFEDLRLSS